MGFRSLLLATLIVAAGSVLIQAQTDQAKVILKRGDALVVQAKYKDAIEEYSKVSTRAGDSYARAIYNIGVCYYELWQTDEAVNFYRRSIELKQGNYPKASYALGVALDDQQKFAEARQAYEQAIKASRNEFAPATHRLGVLEAKAGELQKAATLFRDAASRDGRHRAASHNNLGVMLAELGLLKDAEAEFVMALKRSDGMFDDATHNLKLCRSLINQGTELTGFSRIKFILKNPVIM